MFGFLKKKDPPAPKPTREEVEAKYAEDIRAMVETAANLEKADVPSRSRFGGGPALLPPDLSWPRYEGEPMRMVVQIDLREATDAVPELLSRFPAQGILQVFVDEESNWCSELSPDEDAPVRVFLHPDQDLRTATGPGYPDRGTGIRFSAQKTLSDEFLIEVLSSEEHEAIFQQYMTSNDQLGGWASPVQNDPAEDGRVLLLALSIEGQDGFYITAEPGPLKEGLLEDVNCEAQYD